MTTIIYQIFSGVAPFSVHLDPPLIEDQVIAELGEYVFGDIPPGYYMLTITDSLDCSQSIEIEAEITEAFQVISLDYTCALSFVPEPGPPTTSTTTTTVCTRPAELVNVVIWDQYTNIATGMTTYFTGSLASAVAAKNHLNSDPSVNTVAGITGKVLSFTTGKKVYNFTGLPDSCSVVADGYYLYRTTGYIFDKIVRVYNSIITEIIS